MNEPANKSFLETFAPDGMWFHAWMHSDTNAWAAFGVGLDVTEHPDMKISILFYSSPDPGQPPMQLQLGWEWGHPHGLPAWSDPIITVDLDWVQADYVMTHGVPDALVDAMIDSCRTHECVAVEGDYLNMRLVFVEPGPYFVAAVEEE